MTRDLYKSDAALATAVKGVDKWQTSDANKKTMLQFLNFIGCSSIRKLKYLNHMKKVVVWLKTDFDKATKEDVARVIKCIEEQGYAVETEKDYKRVLRKFYKVLYGNDEEYPDCVRWVKVTKQVHRKKKKLYFSKEEVDSIVGICQYARNKAFVAGLFESCCRPSEWLNVQLKDVRSIDNGFEISVSGKTGTRPIFLFSCVSYMADWLNSHPEKHNPSAYLWVQITTNTRGKPLTLTGARKLLQKLGRRAGIMRKMDLYQMRRGGLTYKRATLRVSDRALENYAGWTAGSGQVREYDQSTGHACKDEIAEKLGVQVPQPTPAKLCFRCKERLSNGEPYCRKCGSPTDERALYTEKYDAVLNELVKNPKVLQALKKVILELSDRNSLQLTGSHPR